MIYTQCKYILYICNLLPVAVQEENESTSYVFLLLLNNIIFLTILFLSLYPTIYNHWFHLNVTWSMFNKANLILCKQFSKFRVHTNGHSVEMPQGNMAALYWFTRTNHCLLISSVLVLISGCTTSLNSDNILWI